MKKIVISVISLVMIVGLAACNTAAEVNLPDYSAEVTSPAAESQNPTTAATEAAQNPVEAPSLEGLQASYEAIYDAVLPSVVSIEVSSTVVQSTPSLPDLPFDFGLPQDQNQDNNQQEYQESGAGSGFVWDTEGHIITNNHVIEGADSIRVIFANGTSAAGEVIGSDSASDLAVVKVDVPASELTPIQVTDSTKAKVGQLVVAIGNPYRLSSSMTTGIISGLGRSLSLDTSTSATVTYTIPDVIQTDAAINPGNSGGVLVDINGRLLGVTTAIESPVRANSGIGYVVPSIIVQKIVPFLIQDGFYQQPYIGISGTDLTPELAAAMDLDGTQRGALVIDVSSGTPAEAASLQGSDRTASINGQDTRVGGDVITAVDGNAINDFEDLTAYLARYTNVGQTIEISYLRDGQEKTTSLTLAARPGTEAGSTTTQTEETASSAWLGITGVDMSDEIASAMELNPTPEGVLVEQISAGSPADEAGLRGSYKPLEVNGEEILVGGDIITAAGNTPVSGINALASTIATYQSGDEITLTILRSGKEMKVSVTLAEKP